MQQFDIQDAPVAVFLTKRLQTDEGWLRVDGFSCGGYSCATFDGYALVLPLLSTIRHVIEDIADERFLGSVENNLDYGVEGSARDAYKAFVAKHGLEVGAGPCSGSRGHSAKGYDEDRSNAY